MKSLCGQWPPVGAALILVLALGGALAALGGAGQPVSEQDKHLNGYLRTVINAGADLFNLQRDYEGCNRLYEGTLRTIRPLVKDHPELQTTIDNGLAEAKTKTSVVERAFVLRRALDQVREGLVPTGRTPNKSTKPPDTGTKPPDTGIKPPDTGTKPPDTGTKPPDKGTKPPDTGTKPPDKGTKPPDKGTKPPEKTMWERLGSDAGVGKVVDDFTARVLKDPKVDFTRKGKYKVKVPQMKKALVDIVSELTGGPYKYKGKSMADVHKGMGITNAEFSASVEDLRKALEKHKVQPADMEFLLKAVESTRPLIVEEPADVKLPGDNPKDKTGTPKVNPKDKTGAPDTKPGGTPPPPANPGDTKKNTPPPANPGDVPKDPPPTGQTQLSGQVRHQGKPLDQGYLTLLSADGRKLSTYIHMDGTYHFQMPLPPGQFRVAVESVAGAVPGAPPQGLPVPVRYTNPATSGLTVSLRPGNQSQNFDLVP